MQGMPIVIQKLREADPRVRIMLGGAPISPDVVRKYGADGYANSAATAVDEAVTLLGRLRERAEE